MKGIVYVYFLSLFFSCQKSTSYPKVVVYGHTGTSIYSERTIYPPNTKESVLYALDVLDADGVEVDVQLTKDSTLILFHEDYFELATDGEGCVGDKDILEIRNITYTKSKYKIAELSDIIDICMKRNKKLFIDMKTFNFCSNEKIDISALNYGLKNAISNWDAAFVSNITFNAKGIEFLDLLEDTLVQKSFETPFLDLGIDYFKTYDLDKLTFRIDQAEANYLNTMNALGIPYCIYGIKTQKEIKAGHALFPAEVITDNIAYSNKLNN